VGVICTLLCVLMEPQGAAGCTEMRVSLLTPNAATTPQVRRFEVEQLRSATNSMDKQLLLGTGGFGPVFRMAEPDPIDGALCVKFGLGAARGDSVQPAPPATASCLMGARLL
jgi:hypothetical protein